MKRDMGLEKLGQLIGRPSSSKKPPAYLWQELALRVIEDLAVPNKKRNAVFKVCKNYHKYWVEKCLIDTKELCQGSECWRYFFKLISQKKLKQGKKLKVAKKQNSSPNNQRQKATGKIKAGDRI